MKSLIPEQFESAGRYGHELSKFVFGLADEGKDADTTINALLEHVGEMLGLDSITVMECVDNFEAVRCNYEWGLEGCTGALGTEVRYISDERIEWDHLYKSDKRGVYEYRKSSNKALLAGFVAHKERIGTLIQVPIYSKLKLIGFVNYNTYDNEKVWDDELVDVIKNISRALSSYLFGMRNLDESREQLNEMMKSDSVTKLPHYDEFLDTITSSSNVGDMDLAVCCSDITNFKYINEKYGYDKGDAILRMFARSVYGFFDRVIACTREYSDNFCFAVKFHNDVAPEIIENRFKDFAGYCEQQAAKLLDGANVCFNIGIDIMKAGETGVDEAVANANVARKWAREEAIIRHGRTALFSNDMVAERLNESKVVSELQGALENHEFHVYFQPKADAVSLKIVGAEALVRWIKADGTMVYPDQFIPAFEKNGCIVRVDYCVYDQVFKYLRDRLDKGLPCVRISMNVSRVHLYTKAFISYIEALMQRYNIPPEYLEFELTESVYIDDLPNIKYTIDHIRRMGINISVDDFGSGYSSLEILTKYEFDVLKLDRVFMKEEMTADDKIIVGTLIDMCKRLGLGVLCEGVENAEQLEFLRSCCCDVIQGYYFSKPICEEAFNKLLDNVTE